MVDSTPTATGAAVDDQVDPARQIALHMLGGGGRDVAGEIGRRRHHSTAEGLDDVARHLVGRDADRDAYRGRRSRVPPPAQNSAFGSTRVSGPGQNASASAQGRSVEQGDLAGGAEIGDMGDQRIEGRPALGLVEPGDCSRRCRHRRRGRKPSRSETPRGRPRPEHGRRWPWRPHRLAERAFSGLYPL